MINLSAFSPSSFSFFLLSSYGCRGLVPPLLSSAELGIDNEISGEISATVLFTPEVEQAEG
jgi:hypothetical protein